MQEVYSQEEDEFFLHMIEMIRGKKTQIGEELLAACVDMIAFMEIAVGKSFCDVLLVQEGKAIKREQDNHSTLIFLNVGTQSKTKLSNIAEKIKAFESKSLGPSQSLLLENLSSLTAAVISKYHTTFPLNELKAQLQINGESFEQLLKELTATNDPQALELVDALEKLKLFIFKLHSFYKPI